MDKLLILSITLALISTVWGLRPRLCKTSVRIARRPHLAASQSNKDPAVETDMSEEEAAKMLEKLFLGLQSGDMKAVSGKGFDVKSNDGKVVMPDDRAKKLQEDLLTKLNDKDVLGDIFDEINGISEQELMESMEKDMKSFFDPDNADPISKGELNELFGEVFDSPEELAEFQKKTEEFMDKMMGEMKETVKKEESKKREEVVATKKEEKKVEEKKESSSGVAKGFIPTSEGLDNMIDDKLNDIVALTDNSILSKGQDPFADIDIASNDKAVMFSNFLKASIEELDSTTENMKGEDVIRLSEQLRNGTVSDNDMKALLGDIMFNLASSMKINMTEEVMGTPESQAQISMVMQKSLSEMMKNIESLDKEADDLFQRLESIKTQAVEETTKLDEENKEELDELLLKQQSVKEDLLKSKAMIESSTAQLENVLLQYTKNADLLTSLVLFPLKRADQKFGFVVGLALSMKTFYDLPVFIANDNYVSLAIQTVGALIGFYHYGLLTAIYNTIVKPPKLEK